MNYLKKQFRRFIQHFAKKYQVYPYELILNQKRKDLFSKMDPSFINVFSDMILIFQYNELKNEKHKEAMDLFYSWFAQQALTHNSSYKRTDSLLQV